MPVTPPTYKPRGWTPPPDRRNSSFERGYDTLWRKRRLSYLRRNPLCVHCLKEDNIYIPATDVDHIIPARELTEEEFWNEENWQSLCHSCHSRKTASGR